MSKMALSKTVYTLATGDDDARLCRDIPDAQCNDQPQNFGLHVIAQSFSKTGDALADAKVVLPWLIGTVGAPVFLLGLLVPVRESLALLPQILVGSILRRRAIRKYFWVTASVVEGACVLGMALVGLSGMTGAAAGWSIFGLLVGFSLARGIASIAAKDVLGKTVSKSRRGRVNGLSASAAGLAASAVGVLLILVPEAALPDWVLYAMLVAAAASWLAAALTYAGLAEHPGATGGGIGLGDVVRRQWEILSGDRELQKFLLARTLMIATALMGPIYVVMLQREAADLTALGWLILATGAASALSSWVWGVFSDLSSRRTMAAGAVIAGLVGLGSVMALGAAPSLSGSIAFNAGALFALGIAHAGVRVGRKTHIVDLAGKDEKADYVALSNSLIGVLLLVMGAFSGIVLTIGMDIALASLAVLSLVGAGVALTMRDVQVDQ